MRISRLDAILAGILAMTPLLPTGLAHLGWPERGYIDIIPLALALVWAIARLAPGHRPPTPGAPLWAWDLLAAAILGAAIHGLMFDHRVLSPVFVARLASGWPALFRPINQAFDPLYSVRVALTFLEGWVVFRLVWRICDLSFDPQRRAKVALVGWLGGLGLVSGLALLQYVTRFNLHPYWVKANPSLVRTHATLDDPNALGAVMVLGLGVVLGLLRYAGPRWRPLLVGLGALLAASLVTTMSRSALGAAVLAPALVFAFAGAPNTPLQRRVRTGSRWLLAFLAVLVAGSVLLREFVPEQRRTNPRGPIEMIVASFDPRESNGWVLRGRLPWWQAGVAMFRDEPLTGLGLGRYPRLMEGYGGGPVRENTHNLFLQMLAETGLVGFTVFVALFVTLGVTLARGVARSMSPAVRGVSLGTLIGLVGLALTLLTGHVLLVPSGEILFASLAGLALTFAGPRSAVTPARADRVGRVLLLAAVAAFAPMVAMTNRVGPHNGRFGYHAGLLAEELTAENVPYRWTEGHARLDLFVPRGSGAIDVPFAVPTPLRAGQPTRVTVETRGAGASMAVSSTEVQRLRVVLPSPAPRRLLVDVRVSPVLLAAPGSADGRRELGMQLFAPVFLPAADVDPSR